MCLLGEAYSEDRGSKYLKNVGRFQPAYKKSHPSKLRVFRNLTQGLHISLLEKFVFLTAVSTGMTCFWAVTKRYRASNRLDGVTFQKISFLYKISARFLYSKKE